MSTKQIDRVNWITMIDEVKYFQFPKKAGASTLPKCKKAQVVKRIGPWDPIYEMKVNYAMAKHMIKLTINNVSGTFTDNPSYWTSVMDYWRRLLRSQRFTEEEIDEISLRSLGMQKRQRAECKSFDKQYLKRNKKLISLYDKGTPVAEITQIFGISFTRVYQIIRTNRRYHIV